jgi:peptidoglycan/xylan/chitin deacetylase (PgdA/CDA1 family)
MCEKNGQPKKLRLFTALSLLLLFLLPPVLAGAEEPRVYVIAYHAFLDRDNRYCFTKKRLAAHLDRLARSGFRFVSFEDIREGRVTGKRNVLVTVDDGNRSVYDAYFQVMKPRGVKPLLAIYPAVIGKQKYALTWEQLQRLAQDGCTIASHGFYHLYVNNKLYRKDRWSFMKEIYTSRSLLEKKLGRKVDVFVYPFGSFSGITIEHLKKAGYSYAFTIYWGAVAADLSKNRDPYRLGRYMMVQGSDSQQLARLESLPGFSTDSIVATNSTKRYPARKKTETVSRNPDRQKTARDKGEKKAVSLKKTGPSSRPERVTNLEAVPADPWKPEVHARPVLFETRGESLPNIPDTQLRDDLPGPMPLEGIFITRLSVKVREATLGPGSLDSVKGYDDLHDRMIVSWAGLSEGMVNVTRSTLEIWEERMQWIVDRIRDWLRSLL